MQKVLTINTTRQPFDGISQTKKIDLKSYRIRGQGRCPPIINLLIIGVSLGLFIYVNTYFLIQLTTVVNGSIYRSVTQTFSCDQYYCDQTTYNFLNYYTYYTTCNRQNCQNIICGNYNCSDNRNYDIDYYYACQPKCATPVSLAGVPNIISTAYVLAIASASVLGAGIVIGLFYGVIMAICGQDLTGIQRFGLIFTWIWPKMKYYAFRKRQIWQNFNFNLKLMVIVDMIINCCYGATLGLFVALYSYGFWQTGPQIACFYMLIWATFSRGSMVGEIAGPFFAANRELAIRRLQVFQ